MTGLKTSQANPKPNRLPMVATVWLAMMRDRLLSCSMLFPSLVRLEVASPGQQRPGYGHDLLIEPPDLLTAVQQNAAHGLGVLVQEFDQTRRMPIARGIGHFDLEADDPAAVLDHEIHLIAGLCAPEVEPTARRQQAAAHAQMLIDQCLEERAQLAGVG